METKPNRWSHSILWVLMSLGTCAVIATTARLWSGHRALDLTYEQLLREAADGANQRAAVEALGWRLRDGVEALEKLQASPDPTIAAAATRALVAIRSR